MAEEGFKIATAFISVEARVNAASVAKARADLLGAARTGAGPTVAPRGPIGQAGAPAGTVGPLGQQLASARADLTATGDEAAQALEQGFKTGLGSLSNMAVQQLRSLSNEARQTPTVRTPSGLPISPLTPAPRPMLPAPDPQSDIAQRLQQQIQQRTQMAQQTMAAQQAAQAQARAQQVGTRPQQRPGTTVGGNVVNNYNTRVSIEPRFIRQLLDVVREVNQLKSSNRAQRR